MAARRRVGAALLSAALLSSYGPRAAQAEPTEDEWWGPDKAMHLGAGVGLSVGGYAIGIASLDDRLTALGLGAGLALGLGALKEALDAMGLGTPSWKDFTWTAAGTALGLGLSVSFDLALRGPTID